MEGVGEGVHPHVDAVGLATGQRRAEHREQHHCQRRERERETETERESLRVILLFYDLSFINRSRYCPGVLSLPSCAFVVRPNILICPIYTIYMWVVCGCVVFICGGGYISM